MTETIDKDQIDVEIHVDTSRCFYEQYVATNRVAHCLKNLHGYEVRFISPDLWYGPAIFIMAKRPKALRIVQLMKRASEGRARVTTEMKSNDRASSFAMF